jgi:ABC-2 type transport system permease protein
MFAIFRKELNAFFSSLIGYIAVGVFLLVMGVFLWVIPGFSILDYGYASLELYFEFAPIVLLVLIPAITMRSFAEENKEGTMELLVTKPLRDTDILMGKFLAALALVFFALLPTLLYYFSVWQLGAPKGNIDHGATLGSYIGLFFLSAAFVALGMFASSLSNDQIVAFIFGLLLNVVFYLGFYYLSTLPVFFGKLDDFIERLGFRFHYDAMSRGAIDSRDVIYFFTVIVLCLQGSRLMLEKRNW